MAARALVGRLVGPAAKLRRASIVSIALIASIVFTALITLKVDLPSEP
jgi:hypothetical protein